MPHIVCEYSANIGSLPFRTLLLEVHYLLTEKLPTSLFNCKSRLISHPDYLIGDNKEEHAFFHLDIKILPGRAEELLKQIVAQLHEMVRAFFQKHSLPMPIHFSIGISDLPKVYSKN